MKKQISTLAAAVAATAVLALTPAQAAGISPNEVLLDYGNLPAASQFKATLVGRAAADVALLDPRVPIIVLGARLNPDCSAPAVLTDRLATARVLAAVHPANPVIVTGGHTQAGCPSEATHMRDVLAATGVAPGRISVEEGSFSTVGNALETAHYAAPAGNGPRVGVIVTSPSHVPRAVDTYVATDSAALWLAVSSQVD